MKMMAEKENGMELFGDFKAVRFPEENMIFITHDDYLYYIYNCEYKRWSRYRNAGNDRITVKNYQEVSEEEIVEAFGGKLPQKETDIARLCDTPELCIRDMMDILKEDYPSYMICVSEVVYNSGGSIFRSIHELLLNARYTCTTHTTYLKIRNLLDNAIADNLKYENVLGKIKKLSFMITGKDIYKDEIGIVDGHDDSSYFWIMPTKIIDYSDTCNHNYVSELRSVEISIEEDDVGAYLMPFLDKYFDSELEANKNRVDYYWKDDDGNEQAAYVKCFEWYLTNNYYSFDSVNKVLADLSDTIDALSSGRETEYTKKLREGYGSASKEQIIDFYRRFIFRMEYMMKIGEENGYDLISFMGP